MNLTAWLGDEEHTLQIRRDPDGAYSVMVSGEIRRVEVSEPEPDILLLIIEGYAFEAAIRPDGEALSVSLAGRSYPVRVEDASAGLAGARAKPTGTQVIRSVMAGKIVEVLVQEGEPVAAGAPLLVIEAMKMENEIRAPKEGTVTAIAVRAGQTVELGAELATVV